MFKKRIDFMKLKTVDNFSKINQIKSVFKTKHLLLLIQNVNSKKFKQTKYLKSFKLKVSSIKTFLLAQIYQNSIKNLLLHSFIKNSILTLLYCINNNKTLSKIILFSLCNQKMYLFSIKLNSMMYTSQIVKNSCSFNYYFNNQLIYKFFNSLLKKFNRNNVN